MAVYQLYVKINGVWQWAARIEADDHPAALRKAISSLKPEHFSLPIRLEQEEQAQPPKPRPA